MYQCKKSNTYLLNGSMDVKTDLYKSNFAMPFALNGHYFFKRAGVFEPFVGIGIGTLYSSPRLYFNVYSISGENWGFLARP